MSTDHLLPPAWQVFLGVLTITVLVHVLLVGLVDGWLPVTEWVPPLWVKP